MTAELITEIAYGMIGDDEDGGHDFVQMHLDTNMITVTTGEGYWVNHFPWSKFILSPCRKLVPLRSCYTLRGSLRTEGSPATRLVKHIPPWFPFAQWKRDAIKWRDQYNFAKDYMFGAVKKQWVRTNHDILKPSDIG